MDEMESLLASGLIPGSGGNASQAEFIERLATRLRTIPCDLSCYWPSPEAARIAAWDVFKASERGKSLLAGARYQIAWGKDREAVEWTQWLSSQPQWCGQGSFIEVDSPVEVVEWKWPLSVAVMKDDAYEEAQSNLAKVIDSDPRRMVALLRHVTQPADRVGVSDILIFPQGGIARKTLLGAGALITADLLVLCDLRLDRFGDAAGVAEELLQLTQANAVLLVDSDGLDMAWLVMLIEQLAHDQPFDVAVAQATRRLNWDPRRMMLLSTPLFVEGARLSAFVESLSRRLKQLPPDHSIDLPGQLAWLPPRMGAVDAAHFLDTLAYDSETQGASMAAAVANALPPPSSRAGIDGDPIRRPARFLQHQLSARPFEHIDPSAWRLAHIDPTEALVAGMPYTLELHIGGWREGDDGGRPSFPEPPVQPGESGASLAVVFFEATSKPEPELKTLFLPQTGDSSKCHFKFTVSPESNIFEGWVSVYHNNRLLQDGVLRARVEGGAGGDGRQAPENTEFSVCSSPRPLALGLAERRMFGGTIRLEGDAAATGIRGYGTARVNLPGLREAVEAMETGFNRMPWEDMGAGWIGNSKAAERLSIIAQQGWQLHEAMCEKPLFREMEQSGMPLLVYAADANVRAPLELCYSMPQPASTAKFCPRAADAVAQGRCVDGCDGRQNPRDHVCPMAFWSLSKVIEWRSRDADSRGGAEEVEVTNEPAPGRRALYPLRKLLLARSDLVNNVCFKPLKGVLDQKVSVWQEATSWPDWEQKIKEGPTLLVLMPHVDNSQAPPSIEIQHQTKNPPGIDPSDVVGDPPQQPIVMILGCGAATAWVNFQSLPAQFRRQQAAAVLAPLAQVWAQDAPEMARVLVETLAAEHPGTRPLGEVVLEAKRKMLGEGRLAGLLLLAFGDADWLV